MPVAEETLSPQQAAAGLLKIRNCIGGVMREPEEGAYFENIEPATGAAYGLVPDSGAADVERAVQAAKAAFPAWRDAGVEARAALLEKLAALIEARQEEFIRAESIDTGKPIALARSVDIPRAIANLRAYAQAARQMQGLRFSKPHAETYTLRAPIGVVATISPWNLPLLLFTWKLAPALAAGNCVIAKPSEVTPVTAFMLSELVAEAGFPAGVVSVLHGRGAGVGALITSHPDIKAISFTGGTATGTAIYENAARHLKKVSLELGGKNPTIVFADADFDKAVEGALAAAFANQGQVCLCGSRLLVEAPIYEKFRAELLRRAQALVPADPLEETTRHGAVVSQAHMEKVLSYIALAKQEGGTILLGGNRRMVEGRCAEGYFIEPTIIEGLPSTCRTNQEEIFGSVVTLIPFKDEAEALAIANGTEYGLAASVWTQDKAKAARMAEGLESGIVWLNCWNLRDLDAPFGGVKKSGIGREGTLRALEFFTDEKTVTMLR